MLSSSNKKETPLIDLIPTEDEILIDAVDEEEEDIVDKIMVMQRLTEMEVETLRELLKYNYRYEEAVVDAMDEDEIQEEFKQIWKL